MTINSNIDIQYYPDERQFLRFYDSILKLNGLCFDEISHIWPAAAKRTAERFSHIRNKYYGAKNCGVTFRSAHIGHSILILYELSRTAYRAGDSYLAEKLYYLNNAINSVNILHEIELPLRFFCDHPLGTVIGRANFSMCESFSFSSQCLIGNSSNIYPNISGHLLMLPGSTLLGNISTEGTVILSNGSSIRDAGALRDCIVYGQYPNNKIIQINQQKFFDISNFHHHL